MNCIAQLELRYHMLLLQRTLAPLTAWPLLNMPPQPMLHPVTLAFVHMHQCSTIPPMPAPVVCCCQSPLGMPKFGHAVSASLSMCAASCLIHAHAVSLTSVLWEILVLRSGTCISQCQ